MKTLKLKNVNVKWLGNMKLKNVKNVKRRKNMDLEFDQVWQLCYKHEVVMMLEPWLTQSG